MGRFTTTIDAAKNLHQEYYDSDFEVAVCKRSGGGDFFPFSLVYGLSDIGSWDCIVSCDGNKVVVTKSLFLNVEKVTKQFEITKSDIKKAKIGIFKNKISLNKKIKGIGKKFNFRLQDEFDRKDKLSEKIKSLI
jgi:hypothetical protein